MLHELVKSSDKIEGIVSLWELHANICFLAGLLIDEKDGEEAARVDTPLDYVIIVIGRESTCSKLAVILVNEFYAALG